MVKISPLRSITAAGAGDTVVLRKPDLSGNLEATVTLMEDPQRYQLEVLVVVVSVRKGSEGVFWPGQQISVNLSHLYWR